MITEQAKMLAHELTIEYVKQNKLLSDGTNNIPQLVNEIADIHKQFYDEIKFNKILDELY